MRLLADSTPIVDWAKLGQVVLYSLVTGIGVAICFSFAIVGATRFVELRRNDRNVGAFAFAVLGAAGLAATVGAAVVAIVVMTQKS